MQVRWHTRNFGILGDFERKTSDAGPTASIAMEFKNIPPFKRDFKMPPSVYFLPRIDFSASLIETWNDFT